jgi:hypothetical protein
MDVVFKFEDYKAYIKSALSEKGYGARIKLAEALSC